MSENTNCLSLGLRTGGRCSVGRVSRPVQISSHQDGTGVPSYIVNRRTLIFVWIAAIVVYAADASTLIAAEPIVSRPNVLLICVDDLKPVAGCYGDQMAQTPNIDELAQRGVLCEAAYCNQAVCSPSRNALMTGLRPQTLGIYDLATHFRMAAPDAMTVAAHFRQHGYQTHGLGKILHTGHGNKEDAASWSEPHWRPKAGQYQLAESTVDKRDSKNGPRGAATESADVDDDAYGDGQIAIEAMKRIHDAAEKSDEPFFLAVGFLKPHLPFVAPKTYWDLYDRAKLPMPQVLETPKDAPSYAPQFGGELRAYSDMPQQGPISSEDTRKLIHGYYAATSYTDAQIGKVLTALDKSGLDENTIIVLWGDHGWHLGDHGMWCKHTNYEQAARIPMIVASPGCAAGQKTNSLVETVDIYPTLCELAALPVPSGLDGTSFAGILKSPEMRTRESVIHVYPRGGRLGRAIRTDRYRLVEWKSPGAEAKTAEYELYDYQIDPLETRNLAASQPDVLQELKTILATHPEAKPQMSASKKADSTSKSSGTRDSNKSLDRSAMFRKRDKNGDGVLSSEEFLVGQPDPDEAPKRFPRFDKNGDGSLSEIEFVTSGKQTDGE
ncbi:MAG: sulfatase-like hydrolase/transferase [Planctomycetota bacterium]|nr:sulfatase-like hydrolase/transferase [Planctomycetota bacterium]